MSKAENHRQIVRAYEEVLGMIQDATERGTFNSAYFREPFMEWYTNELDKNEEV